MLSIYQGNVTLQTFADYEGARVQADIRSGPLAKLEPWARAENERGAGIYATVNETDGTWRNASTITRVRAYYCDLDGLTSEAHKAQRAYDLLTSRPPPSAIVRSGGGLHAYWYAVPGEPLDPERYKRVNMGLIAAFHGCPRTKDIARVLRLPGFCHLKDPDRPYLVEVLYEDLSALYTGEAIAKAYPYSEPKPQHRRLAGPLPDLNTPDAWAKVVRAVAEWFPVDGEKHRVLMLALGVAKKFGVSEAQAVDDLFPIVASWPTRSEPLTTLKQNARWAYQHGGDCTVAGLRSVGVAVPSLGQKARAS